MKYSTRAWNLMNCTQRQAALESVGVQFDYRTKDGFIFDMSFAMSFYHKHRPISLELTDRGGIYSFWVQRTCIYVGQTINFVSRFGSHAQSGVLSPYKDKRHGFIGVTCHLLLLGSSNFLKDCKHSLLVKEAELIGRFKPSQNWGGNRDAEIDAGKRLSVIEEMREIRAEQDVFKRRLAELEAEIGNFKPVAFRNMRQRLSPIARARVDKAASLIIENVEVGEIQKATGLSIAAIKTIEQGWNPDV